MRFWLVNFRTNCSYNFNLNLYTYFVMIMIYKAANNVSFW